MPDIVDLNALSSLPPGIDVEDECLRRIHEWGTRHPEVFAGMVVSGHTVYVGFTQAPEQHLGAVRSEVPGVKIRAFRAQNSYLRLRELVDEISRDLDALSDAGIEISSLGPDERRNRVVVRLLRDDAGWRRTLEERYPSDLLTFQTGGRIVAC